VVFSCRGRRSAGSDPDSEAEGRVQPDAGTADEARVGGAGDAAEKPETVYAGPGHTAEVPARHANRHGTQTAGNGAGAAAAGEGDADAANDCAPEAADGATNNADADRVPTAEGRGRNGPQPVRNGAEAARNGKQNEEGDGEVFDVVVGRVRHGQQLEPVDEERTLLAARWHS